MTEPQSGSIRPFYADWARYQARIVDGLRGLSADALAVRPGPDSWPIWAIAAHTAGARVYWLCNVFGESGADKTPFPDADGEGWEDHLDTPRSADEIVHALETSWRIVDECLDRWTPAMLDEAFPRVMGSRTQSHTRQSVLMRLITHDAYHAGEIALLQGMHGRPQLDLWPPQVAVAEPAVAEPAETAVAEPDEAAADTEPPADEEPRG